MDIAPNAQGALNQDPIIDSLTGYAINVPAIYQGDPFWWETDQAAYDRIRELREAEGITVNDFPHGKPQRKDAPIRVRTTKRGARA